MISADWLDGFSCSLVSFSEEKTASSFPIPDSSPTNACMCIKTTGLPCWPQEVSRCCTRGESQYTIVCRWQSIQALKAVYLINIGPDSKLGISNSFIPLSFKVHNHMSNWLHFAPLKILKCLEAAMEPDDTSKQWWIERSQHQLLFQLSVRWHEVEEENKWRNYQRNY